MVQWRGADREISMPWISDSLEPPHVVATQTMPTPRHVGRYWRTLAGLVISAFFLWLTAQSVDMGALRAALGDVAWPAIFVAGAIAVAEVTVRGWRWRRLLAPIVDVPTVTTTAYLCIGHLANAILPARLGDLVRMHLAARRFGVARLPTLGTLVIERISDAGFLAVVVATSVLLGNRDLVPLLVRIGVVGVAVLTILGALMWMIRGSAVARWRRRVRDLALALMEVAPALVKPRNMAALAGATAASFVLATAHFMVLAQGGGLAVSPFQAALLVGAVTLSTAIPAGPASIGTFEFIGVALLTSMGFSAEPSLLVVVVFHAIAVLVPAGLGLVAGWWMHAMPDRRLVDELR